MKKAMNITANLYDPTLLKNLVEKLASRRINSPFNDALIPQQWEAVQTSTTIAYIMGNFDLTPEGIEMQERLNVPFTTQFMFTCLKEKYGIFNLEWSTSLS